MPVAHPFNNPIKTFLDDDGAPLVGGKLYSYEAGTTTPLATYLDADQDATNTNPIILDANGQATIFLGEDAYKFVLHDANDVPQWTVDKIAHILPDTISTAMIRDGAITTAKIDDGAVANEKLAEMATQRFKGRTTAGNGAPEDLTATQATAMLNAFVGDSGSGGTKGLVPAPASGDSAAEKFLKASGAWVSVPDIITDLIRKSFYLNWSAVACALDASFRGIAYGNGIFVAVSSTGTAEARVMRSLNYGVTWMAENATEANQWRKVAYGNGLFIAVADSGTNRIMKSADGETWSAEAAPVANGWWGIATDGAGVWISAASSIATDSTKPFMRSADNGDTWSAITATVTQGHPEIAFGNGVFVAVSVAGTNRVARSTDLGLTWTTVASAEQNSWKGIAYLNEVFIAVSDDGTNRIMRSTDNGATWTAIAAPAQFGWSTIAAGNGAFVAGANDGEYLMVSFDLGLTWELVGRPPTEDILLGLGYGAGVFIGTTGGDDLGVIRSLRARVS